MKPVPHLPEKMTTFERASWMISFVKSFFGRENPAATVPTQAITVDLPDRNNPSGMVDIAQLNLKDRYIDGEDSREVVFTATENAAGADQLSGYLEAGGKEALPGKIHTDLNKIAAASLEPLQEAWREMVNDRYLAPWTKGSESYKAVMARFTQIERGILTCKDLMQSPEGGPAPDLASMLSAAKTLDRALRPKSTYEDLDPELKKLRAITAMEPALSSETIEKSTGEELRSLSGGGRQEAQRQALEIAAQRALSKGTEGELTAARGAAGPHVFDPKREADLFAEVAALDKDLSTEECRGASRTRGGMIRAALRLSRRSGDPFSMEALGAREHMIKGNLVLDPDRRQALISTFARGEALAAAEDAVATKRAQDMITSSQGASDQSDKQALRSTLGSQAHSIAKSLGGDDLQGFGAEDREALEKVFKSQDGRSDLKGQPQLRGAGQILMKLAGTHSVAARLEVKTLQKVLDIMATPERTRRAEVERA